MNPPTLGTLRVAEIPRETGLPVNRQSVESAKISELTSEKLGPRTRRSPLQAFLGTGELGRSDVCKGVYHS
jgi:hypothetical protein